MMKFRLNISKLIRGFAISLVASLLFSCGGGTSGTDSGGRELRTALIQGTVSSEDGEAIENVQIVVVETGEFASSNALGQFELSTATETDKLLLQVTKDKVDQAVEISDIPIGNSNVKVSLDLNQEENLVTIISVKITPIQPVTNKNAEKAQIGSANEENSSQANKKTRADEASSKDAPQEKMMSEIFGKVYYEDGSAASGVKIKLQGSGGSDVTNSKGAFSIKSKPRAGNWALDVQIAGLKDQVVIPGVPDQAVSIEVVLQLSISEPASSNPKDLDSLFRNSSSITPALTARILKSSIKAKGKNN